MKLSLSLLALILGVAGASLLSFDSEFRNFGYFFLLPSFLLTAYLAKSQDKNALILYSYHSLLCFTGIYQFFIK